jgi:hypothetical protein
MLAAVIEGPGAVAVRQSPVPPAGDGAGAAIGPAGTGAAVARRPGQPDAVLGMAGP